MFEVAGALHFLALVGLTGVWLERRISGWPQGLAPLALAVFLAVIMLYAGAVAIGYRGY